MFSRKKREPVGQDVAAAAIAVSRVEILLEELLAEVKSRPVVTVYESVNPAATAAEIARIRKTQGRA